jgi:hypothetical protein
MLVPLTWKGRSGERTLAQPTVVCVDRATTGLASTGISGVDDRFARRRAAVGGRGGDVPLDLDAVADAAHEGCKPPSRAWIVSQRAGRSLALRSEWATPGGTATNPPEETVIVSGSRPISKVSSPSRT